MKYLGGDDDVGGLSGAGRRPRFLHVLDTGSFCHAGDANRRFDTCDAYGVGFGESVSTYQIRLFVNGEVRYCGFVQAEFFGKVFCFHLFLQFL
jgi:hypothetical protein